MEDAPDLPNGLVIPDHQLVRRIGKGGYGEIWLARNILGAYRAVKIVFRARFDNPKPFDREFTGVQAFEPISRSHPGLVNILQVGRNNEAGYFYYIMELADDQIAGGRVEPEIYSPKTLERELRSRGRLPVLESLQIGISLAEALAFLHDAGLVHRDIKPSNIIFVNGRPKLADIGLVVTLSDANTFVGSDGYIPPEGPGSFRADIYSFGKVLYEISTGQNRNSFPELPKAISAFEDCEGILELNEVVVKACANVPSVRYARANDLRADLEMLMAGRSVKRLRFVERQLARVKRLAAAAIVLALVAGALAYGMNRVRKREQQLLATAYVASGTRMVEDGNLHAALPLFAEALRLEPDGPAAEAHRLRIGMALQESPKLLQFWDYDEAVQDLHFSPDGQHILIAGGQTVRLFNIRDEYPVAAFQTESAISSAVFSPDGRRLAVANGRYITLMDRTGGTNIFHQKKHALLRSANFSGDATALVLGCTCRSAHIIDAATGESTEADLKGHSDQVNCAVFGPDGRRILTGSRDGTARLWDRKSRASIVLRSAQWVQDVAFSPDGQRAVIASSDHTMLVWELFPEPRVLCRMEHSGSIQSTRYSPDGRWIVSAGMDRTVRFWHANTGKPAAPLVNMHAPALHAVFAPDGRRVAIGGQSGWVRLWDMFPETPLDVGRGLMSANGERYVTLSSNSLAVWNARDDSPVASPVTVSDRIFSVWCSTNAHTVVVAGTNGPDNCTPVYVLNADSHSLRKFRVAALGRKCWLNGDGTMLLNTHSKYISIWNAMNGDVVFGPESIPASVVSVAFSPDGRTLALGCDKTLMMLNATNGQEMFPPIPHSKTISAISFADDGSKFVTVTEDEGFNPGSGAIFDSRTGHRLVETRLHIDGVRTARFSHDPRFVATGGEDGVAIVWSTETGKPLVEPIQLVWKVVSVDFSQNNRWLIASSWYETGLWEIRTGRPLTPILPIPDAGFFNESGLCADRTRLWGLSTRGLYFWNLARSAAQPEEVMALADHLGVTIPTGLAWNPKSFPVEKLRERCTAAMARTEATLESWHRQQMKLCENEKDFFAAQFHRRLSQTHGNLMGTNVVSESSRP